ncbi:methylamine utilization protein MauJ [Hyphomicrobium sulfonivorans]|uniref:methylamine utilization protein MauJ n=1 Tax=Hyphomicrobium sulfonivorans TaxID=121290 RepID=UPI0015706195|nr:methylamine utilization protein MauJ [Hyphomicrobium sulfonivorans]MBI1649736.1 methylamine utilization protein MauJ [Hyphomicrobium sulfonivorans]NSL71650.1 hypothetical protein [Hyphomicrobium sulfonivorans]
MWIPHNQLGPLRAESSGEVIEASQAATEERMFVVGFILCNTLTKAWETDLLVVPDEAKREIEIDGRPATLHASANVAGKLHELIYTFKATSAADALAPAYRHVNDELDKLALQYGRSFELVGWRLADVEYEARWRFVPFRPSALLPELKTGTLPEAYAEALQLYRQARNAVSPAWRLIAAGAIVDAAVSRRAPFDSGEIDYATLPVAVDVLVRSGTLMTHPELKDANMTAVRDVVQAARKAQLEQLATFRASPAVHERRDFASMTALVALANLADLAAHNLLTASLREKSFFIALQPADQPEMTEA